MSVEDVTGLLADQDPKGSKQSDDAKTNMDLVNLLKGSDDDKPAETPVITLTPDTEGDTK